MAVWHKGGRPLSHRLGHGNCSFAVSKCAGAGNFVLMIGQSHNTCCKLRWQWHLLQKPGLESLRRAPCHSALRLTRVCLLRNFFFKSFLGTTKSAPCLSMLHPSKALTRWRSCVLCSSAIQASTCLGVSSEAQLTWRTLSPQVQRHGLAASTPSSLK